MISRLVISPGLAPLEGSREGLFDLLTHVLSTLTITVSFDEFVHGIRFSACR